MSHTGGAGVKGLYGMVDVPPSLVSLPGGVIPTGEVAAAVGFAERLAGALLSGGARILQVRMKAGSPGAMLAVAERLLELLQGRGARLLINDRLDVALAAGAHGVHLGQTDLPLLSARRLCPPGFCIGVSTHDEEQAQRAQQQGADYIAFGPVYPTASKHNPEPVVGTSRLAAVCARASVPVVAIGGITLDRVPAVVAAGASAAAMIAAVNQAPDIAAAARAVTQLFAARR